MRRVFVIFLLAVFNVPAKMSIIPEMVAKEDLHIANIVNTTGMDRGGPRDWVGSLYC